jgi:uncharacterized peroxidase-related enzyme
MDTFKVHDPQSAPEAARETLQNVKSKYGFVPNLMGVLAAAPPALKAYATLSGLLDQTSFSPVERQILLLTVSRENGCHYCMSAHTASAKASGVPDDVVEALRADRALPDTKLEALRRSTVQVLETHGHPSAEDLQAFSEAGFKQAQVLEVLLAIAMKTLSNYTNHIADTPLDDAFAKTEWRKTGTG